MKPVHYGVRASVLTVYEAGKPIYQIPTREAKRIAATLADVALKVPFRGVDGQPIEVSERMRFLIARDLLKVALEEA